MTKKIIYGLLVGCLFFIVGCSQAKNDSIKIGSKDFTENLIISEVYALALEENGYKVERVPNIASSVIPQSIKKGEIDLYPEYTGTALLSILKLPLETDPQKVAELIRDAYENEGVLTTLDFAPANDSAGIAIKTSIAEKMNIRTLSEFQEKADQIRFASQGEFDLREDGLPGLEKSYGIFNFKSSKVYDNSLKYQVLKSDEADATPAYTTEGQLVDTDNYIVLEDDKQFWPPYNVVPIVRQSLLKTNPKIKEIINHVNQNLDTETVIKLNAQVDVNKKDYLDVAKNYYQSIK